MPRRHNALLAEFYRNLNAPMRDSLRAVVAVANSHEQDVFLVGGAVRDLLLGVPVLDIDFVTEGDASRLASAVGRKLGVRVVLHHRFGTGTVHCDDHHIDFARARSERYERPAALPAVEPGSIVDDLRRRDFTIHAMALRVTSPAGELIDPFGGRDDLAARRIRVLHGESFRDDPTRILRALRYSGRLRFRIERQTAVLLARDVSYIDRLSGARIRHELERIAVEERAAVIVRSARLQGVLQRIDRAVAPDGRALRGLAKLRAFPEAHRDAIFFCFLLASARGARQRERAIERLTLKGPQRRAVRSFAALVRQERRLARPSLRPSAASRIFDGEDDAAIEALALYSDPLVVRRARRYLDDWRHVRPRLNGHELERFGVPRGPRIGALLEALRDARLDGAAHSMADEVLFVERALGRGSRTSRA